MDRETNQGQPRRLTPEEKEIRKKKLQRKKRIRIAIVITCFALLIALIVSPIVLFALFRVNGFAVEGISPYSKEEIINASGIEKGKSLIFVDIDEAKEAIEKNLPYTDEVVIKRKLPDTVVIRYGETKKTCAVQISGGAYALTDSSLKVLELVSDVPDGIIHIKGAVPVEAEVGTVMSFAAETDKKEDAEQATDRTKDIIIRVLSAIPEEETANVNMVDFSSFNNIYLIYKERVVMRLGESTDIEPRIDLAFRSLAVEIGIDPSVTGIITSTILKEAYFNPQDTDDIKELVLYSGGEWTEPEMPKNPAPEETENDE